MRSTDAVELAAHDLGGHGAPLLISHATGFHGRCYQPLANTLAGTFHSVAFDYRGHGDTPAPSSEIDWLRLGDDAESMGAHMVRDHGGPIAAFGHSMGGACLLIAAHRNPDLFSRIVVFEPIVFPPAAQAVGGDSNPLVAAARRRRESFDSFEAAIANFASKPPLAAFKPEALTAYVRHGFSPASDGKVHLKCHPDTEADTFAAGQRLALWHDLPAIDTRVHVVAGNPDNDLPASIAPRIATRLPNATYLRRDDLDHFAPMTQPDVMAEIIETELLS